MNNSELTINDLILNNQNGNIQSGGFLINNLFLNNNESAMFINNKQNELGDKVSDFFKDLAIPSGLLYLQQKPSKKIFIDKNSENNEKIIDDDLYEKLFKLLEHTKTNKAKTKKHNKKNNKNTRKNKK